MSKSRAKTGSLTYGVSGGTFQGILEADRTNAYGHSNELQIQDGLIGGLLDMLLGGTGTCQVSTDAVTTDANPDIHVATAPAGLRYQIDGVVYQLAANVTQGFDSGTDANYLFLDQYGVMNHRSTATELTGATADVLICRILDSGGLGTVDMNPTGKHWMHTGCILSDTSSATPNAENTKAHTLGRVPIGYWVIGQGKAGSFYHAAADTAWTKDNFYFKCDIASVVYKIVVF